MASQKSRLSKFVNVQCSLEFYLLDYLELLVDLYRYATNRLLRYHCLVLTLDVAEIAIHLHFLDSLTFEFLDLKIACQNSTFDSCSLFSSFWTMSLVKKKHHGPWNVILIFFYQLIYH